MGGKGPLLRVSCFQLAGSDPSRLRNAPAFSPKFSLAKASVSARSVRCRELMNSLLVRVIIMGTSRRLPRSMFSVASPVWNTPSGTVPKWKGKSRVLSRTNSAGRARASSSVLTPICSKNFTPISWASAKVA